MRQIPESPYQVTFRLAGSMMLMQGNGASVAVEHRDIERQANEMRAAGLTVGHATFATDKYGHAYCNGYKPYFTTDEKV
jgi:hypothetical protein